MVNISIIIPCYNTPEEMIEKCVDSILEQSYQNFEILLIDDGSNQKCRNGYERVSAKDDRICLYLRKNGGVSSARNFGVSKAQGDYIVFADSDDYMLQDFLKEALQIAENHRLDFVIGCNIHDMDAEGWDSIPVCKENVTILEGSAIKSIRPYMFGVPKRFADGKIYIGRGPWTRLVKRELALQVPFIEGLAICEDIIWNLEILEKCNRICYVSKAWYVYNISNTQASTKRFNPKIIEESKQSLMLLLQYINLSDDNEYKAYCQRCLGDVWRIRRNFLNSEQCKLSTGEKKSIRRNLQQKPWSKAKEKRFFHLANAKDKCKSLIYRLGLF